MEWAGRYKYLVIMMPAFALLGSCSINYTTTAHPMFIDNINGMDRKIQRFGDNDARIQIGGML